MRAIPHYGIFFRDLLLHPRWAWQVEQILAAVERRDLPALNRLVTRWFPLSHPIALALLGFVEPEEIVFLDIETLIKTLLSARG
ncbi:MAG: hypothetical protein ABDI20_05390 [Candidatus Bipolaricaulaceae bacterium]